VLVVFVLGSIIAAVVVPWQLSSRAGFTSLDTAIAALIRGETSRVRTDVIRFFMPARATGLEMREELFFDALVNMTDPKAIVQRLARTGTRHFPDGGLRYNCAAFLTGEMYCAAFDSLTGMVAGQIVLPEHSANGTVTMSNQLQWNLDDGDLWNASYPNNADDLGEYNATNWVEGSLGH
jgi:hypothetical protein